MSVWLLHKQGTCHTTMAPDYPCHLNKVHISIEWMALQVVINFACSNHSEPTEQLQLKVH